MKIRLFLLTLISFSLNSFPPDFLIIGEQKCGTTSLYNYLIQHPYIQRATRKEIFYFSDNYDKGLDWYKNHFSKTKQPHILTGEATTDYLHFKQAPERVNALAPDAKIICIVRNPIERIFSAYHYIVKKLKLETRTFEQVVQDAGADLGGRAQKLLSSKKTLSNKIFTHRLGHEYLTRGMYITHIKNWLNYFPQDQLLILTFDELINEPKKTVNRVFKFLNLEELTLSSYITYNKGEYRSKIPRKIARSLKEFYQPYNKELEQFLEKKLNW